MQIERAHEDGRVTFQDGSVVLAEVILHCTGYLEALLTICILTKAIFFFEKLS